MIRIFGLILIVLGIFLGLYLGLYLMFIGGITQIVDAVQVDPVDGSDVAWGIVRIIFASAVGAASFWICVLPGAALLFKD